jgi:hypothetical protein
MPTTWLPRANCGLGYAAIMAALASPALKRKRCELARAPRGYDPVLKRVGIQY